MQSTGRFARLNYQSRLTPRHSSSRRCPRPRSRKGKYRRAIASSSRRLRSATISAQVVFKLGSSSFVPTHAFRVGNSLAGWEGVLVCQMTRLDFRSFSGGLVAPRGPVESECAYLLSHGFLSVRKMDDYLYFLSSSAVIEKRTVALGPPCSLQVVPSKDGTNPEFHSVTNG